MTVYDFTVKTSAGEEKSLRDFEGDVLLIVNTASKCGFTPQFEGLESLYQAYKDRGFAIIGFPSNQFGEQDPGTNDEIQQFCKINYGVTFPVMAKVDVNGPNEDPLYTFLKQQQGGDIGWNFTKFLIDRNGAVVNRYEPGDTPESIAPDIGSLLEHRDATTAAVSSTT